MNNIGLTPTFDDLEYRQKVTNESLKQEEDEVIKANSDITLNCENETLENSNEFAPANTSVLYAATSST